MGAETLKQTAKIAAGLYQEFGWESADAYLDLVAEVWGEETALAVSVAVWG